MRQPACRSAVSQSCSATSTIRAEATAKSPLAQACCWRCLIASKSGFGVSSVLVIGGASVSSARTVSYARSTVRRRSRRVIGSGYPSSEARYLGHVGWRARAENRLHVENRRPVDRLERPHPHSSPVDRDDL